MIKLSDFPDGTIVEICGMVLKREGDSWVTLDGNISYTEDGVASLEAKGWAAVVMGIPYPVALQLAEWLDGQRLHELLQLPPEQRIVEAGKHVNPY